MIQEGRVSPCLTSIGNVHIGQFRVLTATCLSTNDCESTVSIDFGVTNTFEQVGEFINMESADSEDQLCFSQVHMEHL